MVELYAGRVAFDPLPHFSDCIAVPVSVDRAAQQLVHTHVTGCPVDVLWVPWPNFLGCGARCCGPAGFVNMRYISRTETIRHSHNGASPFISIPFLISSQLLCAKNTPGHKMQQTPPQAALWPEWTSKLEMPTG